MHHVHEQNIGVLIPSLDPDEKLIQLLAELVAQEQFSQQIVVVDDGTRDQTIFNQIAQTYPTEVVILHHSKNQGKGAALKTGFHYFLFHCPHVWGIATLDSDGQHTVKDLNACIAAFNRHPLDLLIGVRTFSNDIPFRSRIGNIVTNTLVDKLTGLHLTDTQTGLRVIPDEYARKLLKFPADRFEFEFDMLLQAKDYYVTIYEQPIATIYLEENASSHFRVIRDSLAIYARFFKFASSGLLSFFTDIALFALLVRLISNYSFKSIMLATMIARLLSAVVNYSLNRQVVFEKKGEKTLVKYGALMLVQMLLSGYGTALATHLLKSVTDTTLLVTAMKMVVDFILFMFSYQVQKHLIFTGKEHHDGSLT